MPLETAAERSAKAIGTVLTATMGVGDLARPFTLKNLEAPMECSEIKHLDSHQHWGSRLGQRPA